MLQEKIEILKNWIKGSNNIVFFGGAGVSTESGIPDFRSNNGLYNIKSRYSPETILSHRFFMNETEAFYEFYREKMIYSGAKPNITHQKLVEWEKDGRLKGVITQNIDGLHYTAGSKNVLELHGSVLRNYCMICGEIYDDLSVIQQTSVPLCVCGGIIKPDIILYEESLNEKILARAVRLLCQAELLIIGGTSLSVYPAAGLIKYYTGNKMVLINKTATQYDSEADLLFTSGLGEVFSQL